MEERESCRGLTPLYLRGHLAGPPPAHAYLRAPRRPPSAPPAASALSRLALPPTTPSTHRAARPLAGWLRAALHAGTCSPPPTPPGTRGSGPAVPQRGPGQVPVLPDAHVLTYGHDGIERAHHASLLRQPPLTARSGGAGRGRPRRPSPGGRCPPRRAVLSASAVSAGGSPARRREGGEESRGHDRAPSEVHARPPPCPGPRRHLAAGSAPSGGRRRCAGRDGHRARCDGHRASPSAPRASGTAACRSPASPSVVSTGRAARGAVGTAGLRRAHGSGRRARGGRWALGWAGGRGRRGALRGRARGGGRRGEAAVRFWSGAWRRARGGRGDARGPREGRDGTAPAWPAERAAGRSRGQGGGRAQETY